MTELPSGDNYKELLERREAINATLDGLRPFSPAHTLNEAMGYVLFPGGKRLRSIMTLIAGEAFGQRTETLLTTAAAIELLHTASLVFDDLPYMDDTRERHGKPALHVKYSPDLAVLCGHSLVSLALYLPTQAGIKDDAVRRIVAELALCIGPKGMAAGQAEDLCGQQGVNAENACRVATCKTSPLFRAAAYCGAVAAGASEEHASSLREYGMRLGTAYQIADDLRDQEREDNPERSTNVVAALGTDGAVHAFNREVDLAKVSLNGIPRKNDLLDFAEAIRSFCHA